MIKTVKRAAFGFLLGVAVGNIIAALTGHPNIVSAALLERAGSLQTALLLQSLFSGLIGFVGFGAVSIYKIENWSLFAADVTHLALVLAAFIPSAIFLGWTSSGWELLIMAAIMSAAHLAIFLIMCARYRAQVRELNRIQSKRINKEHEIGGAI